MYLIHLSGPTWIATEIKSTLNLPCEEDQLTVAVLKSLPKYYIYGFPLPFCNDLHIYMYCCNTIASDPIHWNT